MRIEFASGTREPAPWPGGTLRIGSADDNDLRLDGGGVAARHARLTRDRRGLVLDVEPGAGRVYVNARPVRERALLRLGDTLGIGGCRLRLCADAVAGDGIDTSEAGAVAEVGAATMALRAVAGPLSGRVWPLSGRLELDAQGPVSVPREAVLALTADGHHVQLDGTALDDAAAVRVNGLATRRARLADGDQLAIGTHRFVLDVSARPDPVRLAPEPSAAEPESEAVRTGAPHREMGWLIATAALLALALAWALLAHY